MKFTCEKADLLYGVQVVSRAIAGRNTNPIMNGLYICANSDGLELKSTDGELAIKCNVAVDVAEQGSVVVADGKRFLSIIKALPNGYVTISSINDFDIKVDYGSSAITVKGLEADLFPVLPTVNGITGYMPGEVFSRVVRQVATAVSTNPITPIYTGFCLTVDGNNLRLVSTDMHRLSLVNTVWSYNGEEKGEFIVPSKAMREIAGFANADGEVAITLSKKHILAESGGVTLIARLLSGTFPNVMAVFPKQIVKKTMVDRAEITSALKRAALFGADDNHTVKLNFGSNGVEMSAMTNTIGGIKETLTAKDFDGKDKDLLCGYNLKYLLDFLGAVDSDNVIVELSGELTPCLLSQEDDESFVYLLLPLRLVK